MDGDDNWQNGCEQARGYTTSYVFGTVYDSVFDSHAGGDGCNPDYTATGGATPPCDPRSSGFAFPIPGAWYWNGSFTTNNVAEFLAHVGDIPNPLANRAFDCSQIFRTGRHYEADGTYHATPRPDLLTFGEAFHVNTSVRTTVCNRNTGRCVYTCATGWDDFDVRRSSASLPF